METITKEQLEQMREEIAKSQGLECGKDARCYHCKKWGYNCGKAKFPNSTRSYVYRTEDSVKAGDTVVNAKPIAKHRRLPLWKNILKV